jgi:cell division protein FtsB
MLSVANYSYFAEIVNTLQGMKKIINKIVGYAVWGLMLVLALSLAKSISRANEIRNQIRDEESKIIKIQAENDKLAEKLTQAQSPNFIEKEVRDKLGLGKEGESVVVLPDPEVLKRLAPVIPVEADILPDPNWKKWMKLFI